MSVLIEKIAKDLNLNIINAGDKSASVNVLDSNRPGLQFAGFYDYFANERIQIVGMAEWSFLEAMHDDIMKKRIKRFFDFDMPCIIFTRSLVPNESLLKYAVKKNKWILGSDLITSSFMARLTNYLAHNLAPEITLHGVHVDIYGLGILITGKSGIGKSETALELIKRGHRLIADDAVEIKEVDQILEGKAPELTDGLMEVRGMGIIDVPALYGLSSVISAKNIDLIINLEIWNEDNNYERLGDEYEKQEILGVKVNKITIPIRPGRNIAVIIEAAVANYRYRQLDLESPMEKINRRIFERDEL